MALFWQLAIKWFLAWTLNQSAKRCPAVHLSLSCGHLNCKQNLSIFTCLTPVKPKSWPLTFLLITMKRNVADRSNYTFSESVSQKKYVGMVFDNNEATFEFDPCTNYFCDPWFTHRHSNTVGLWFTVQEQPT